MSYQVFSVSRTPSEPLTFAIPEDIIFPKGESETAPTTDSVQLILPPSTTEREYFLYNHGLNEVRLFFGGDAATWQSDLRTPFRIPPGHYSSVSNDKAKMACFGWSLGGSILTLGVFTP
ncbi:MAG: hypothetical protein AAGF85_20865 [Bacteroidota bacterium]